MRTCVILLVGVAFVVLICLCEAPVTGSRVIGGEKTPAAQGR
ncbi:MAG TPA: hypothetical protein P5287_08460 [bacterium]|nr:hypothetical protein [bacterium]